MARFARARQAIASAVVVMSLLILHVLIAGVVLWLWKTGRLDQSRKPTEIAEPVPLAGSRDAILGASGLVNTRSGFLEIEFGTDLYVVVPPTPGVKGKLPSVRQVLDGRPALRILRDSYPAYADSLAEQARQCGYRVAWVCEPGHEIVAGWDIVVPSQPWPPSEDV